MEWILLSICSAVFLGLYDLAKKTAVRDNAVPPVLLFNVASAAYCWSATDLASTLFVKSWDFIFLNSPSNPPWSLGRCWELPSLPT